MSELINLLQKRIASKKREGYLLRKELQELKETIKTIDSVSVNEEDSADRILILEQNMQDIYSDIKEVRTELRSTYIFLLEELLAENIPLRVQIDNNSPIDVTNKLDFIKLLLKNINGFSISEVETIDQEQQLKKADVFINIK